MNKKIYPPNVIEQAQDVLVGWGQVGAQLTFGNLTQATLTTDLTAAAPIEAEISKLEKQLAEKREERDLLYHRIWDEVKRLRSGFKAVFGDDSQQYEMVGGTRISEKKPRTRKTATP